MIIKALKLYDGGFMTEGLAFGGEGPERIDPGKRYASSLQNFLIDTGSEVILVDTSVPDGIPEMVPDEKTMIYMGKKVNNYVDALEAAGYKKEQVTKILITHKHGDHTGELGSFPNAEIYASRTEAGADELKNLPNVVPVDFKDGAYHNFSASEKIAEGVYMVEAKGHTNGNSVIIAEADGLYYMMHGDVTYTDEALYKNKLSIVFEDLGEARKTLDAVRKFVAENPTVYLSTHTPFGVKNLEEKHVVDLSKMPESLAVAEVQAAQATGKYICSVCGYVYDPAENGGVAWDDLPADWVCPRCKQGKDKFNKA